MLSPSRKNEDSLRLVRSVRRALLALVIKVGAAAETTAFASAAFLSPARVANRVGITRSELLMKIEKVTGASLISQLTEDEIMKAFYYMENLQKRLL